MPAKHRKNGPAARGGTTTTGQRTRTDVPAAATAPVHPCHCPPGYHPFGVHAPGFGPRQEQPPVPSPGLYRVDDLASLTPGEAGALVRRARADAARHFPSCPHILITRDHDSGAVTHAGPFPTGLAALEVAHQHLAQNQAVGLHGAFTLTIAPVLQRTSAHLEQRGWWRRLRA